MRSVPNRPPDASSDALSPAQLRDRLIVLTVQLADELADEGDRDRLEALQLLYQTTRDVLRQRHASPEATR